MFLGAGKRVTQDISLAGFDDMLIGHYFSPALTTVHLLIAAIIQDALLGVWLQASIRRRWSRRHRPSQHQGHLVIRDSVAKWGNRITRCANVTPDRAWQPSLL
ncbi:MAG: substrate-binding domain-containing protein [Candidatus Malihini olakiniferum]